MPKELKVDLVVIGAGPAGQKGAIQAAKAGKRVVIVDRLGLLGGACLNQGTVPSKTLRSVILDLTGFTQSVYHGREPRGSGDISVEDLRSRVERVINDENQVLAAQCESNGIMTDFGTARFWDPYTVEVVDEQGQVTTRIEADKALIATGSRPRHPIDLPDGADGLFVDSDLVFDLHKIPKSLIVLGGGIIGCEYATMFAALGVDVTLIDRRDDLLRMLDGEVADAFAEYITQMPHLQLRLGLGIDQLQVGDDGSAEIQLTEGGVISAETVFYSMGRLANVEGLQLENAGIELTELGFIPVNSLFQSSQEHIYAAGDVIGPPSLASTSVEQGRLAVRNAFLLRSHHFPDFFPYGIYTIPEISSVGPTEEELKKKGTRYEVGRAYYYEMARGPIAGDTQGLIKMLFHAETREVLAVHIIGTHATELISLGQMALSFRVQLDYFVDTIFNYPTFAEGFRIAALNGLNKIDDADRA
jgi:NAD(P) transhydrogenase